MWFKRKLITYFWVFVKSVRTVGEDFKFFCGFTKVIEYFLGVFRGGSVVMKDGVSGGEGGSRLGVGVGRRGDRAEC